MFALLPALLGLASAQVFDYDGWHPNIACPFEPARPKSGRDTCDWIPIKHPLSGCIMRWKCKEIEAAPRPCPEAPAKPTTGKNCNWLAMRDARGCILDYECEPVTQPPCPRRPQRPDNSELCYYRSIKDNDGCVVDYVCEPIGPIGLPVVAPQPQFIAPQQIAAPLPAFDTGFAVIQRAQAQAAAVNQASYAAALNSARQVNFNGFDAFAPRIPILKDDGNDAGVNGAVTVVDVSDNVGARKGSFGAICEDVNQERKVEDESNSGRTDCQQWASSGECDNNKPYMYQFCARSCNVCDQLKLRN